MAYGFPQRQPTGRVPVRQPMGQPAARPTSGAMGRPAPVRPTTAPRARAFSPDQEMEIRRIVQEMMGQRQGMAQTRVGMPRPGMMR